MGADLPLYIAKTCCVINKNASAGANKQVSGVILYVNTSVASWCKQTRYWRHGTRPYISDVIAMS